MRRAVRIAVAAVFLTALIGLCAHYGATYDEGWPHPTGDQLRDDYDAYVGERVLLFGEVQSVDGESNAITIHVTDSADDVAAELEIRGFEKPVEPGGVVQVYGVLEADRTMTPTRTIVVNGGTSAFYYKLGASVAGVLLAIGYFLVHWRPTIRNLGFEPRIDTSARPTTNADGPTDSAEVDRNG
ncbi:nucleic acid-binding protein [Halopiger xanaduensis]|uniref:Nucleic acid binding OB-fold tRNA/helicase-type n=1 Tax=Halopiger xanaduensis (strain DSM 18323 / JCM 14033 / SH-6) TaxID=797210 RepID=F8DA19_HALXS|nr:nucleic acid-binding protein [Halopiger xanaduensis]AEH36935.1 nucleic acid binding OB-fold tRNA/helicase-type [Halopiger xanaduensis SH-6]